MVLTLLTDDFFEHREQFHEADELLPGMWASPEDALEGSGKRVDVDHDSQ